MSRTCPRFHDSRQLRQESPNRQLTEGIHIRRGKFLQNAPQQNINLRGFSQIWIKTDEIKADKEHTMEVDEIFSRSCPANESELNPYL